MSAFTKRVIAAVRRRVRHYFCLRRAKGSSLRAVSDKQAVQRILFLCYGNIYRSPYAEHYMRSILHSYSKLSIASAGFHSKVDRPTPESFQSLALTKDIKLEHHRSRVVDEPMLAEADLIVIMDRWNWEHIDVSYRNYMDKVIWLGAFGNTGIEIVDPYGKPESEARQIMEEISTACQGLKQYLQVAS